MVIKSKNLNTLRPNLTDYITLLIKNIIRNKFFLKIIKKLYFAPLKCIKL